MWPDGVDRLHPFAGFAGMEWGSRQSEIISEWGSPSRIDEFDDFDALALVYDEKVLAGEPASLGFLIHSEEGLIRGQALLPYGEGEDCSRLFGKIRNLIELALPDHEPTVQIDRGPDDLTFCTAFQIGAATGTVAWNDPNTGNRIVLTLDLSAGVVRVSYESATFSRLIETNEPPRRE